MKFKLISPKFHPAVVSWKPGIDVHTVRLELLTQLETLKTFIDEEFDHENDWPEVQWVDKRIANLKRCEGVNPVSTDAKKLIEEFYSIVAIQEELDRICDKEALPVIRNLSWTAANSLVREKET